MMQNDLNTTDFSNQPTYTLSELSDDIKKAFRERFDIVRVQAEISAIRRWSSGHTYFKLVDDDNVLEVVCWKGTPASHALAAIEDGAEVIATGDLTIYGKQSRYQLILKDIEIAGQGVLLRQLEERRLRLTAEGLFDADRKKPLPFLPRIIGVVTSPEGAVIRDILHRLRERFPLHVLVWPTLVQGVGAPEQIVAAIEGFDGFTPHGKTPRPDLVPDLLIIARGGGSIEDLMAFNDEGVVRAVANCSIPVISAVGHETDTTLCDYVSDLRAPTPTAAAEIATPVLAELRQRLDEMGIRLDRKIFSALDARSRELQQMTRALTHPDAEIRLREQRLDIADAGLVAAMDNHLNRWERNLGVASQKLPTPTAQLSMVTGRFNHFIYRFEISMDALIRLWEQRLDIADAGLVAAMDNHLNQWERNLGVTSQKLPTPTAQLSMVTERLNHFIYRFEISMDARLTHRANYLAQLTRLLEASSYQVALERGFAIVSDVRDGAVIKSAAATHDGQEITLQFADGKTPAIITNKTTSLGKAAPKKTAR